MPEITIRRMTMDDVDGVYAVEIGTFVDAWSRDAFVSDMKNPVNRIINQIGKLILLWISQYILKLNTNLLTNYS